MARLVLTPAELAVTLHALAGPALPLDAAALRDLNVSKKELTGARTSLLERGVIVYAPFEAEESAGVSTAFVPLLETVMAPDELCVLTLNRRDAAPAQIYYSMGQGLFARHCVEEPRRFVFEEMPSIPAIVDDMVRASIDAAAVSPPTSADQPAPLVDLLPAATSITTLVRVMDPASADSAAQTASWILSGDALWLVTGEGAAETARRSTIADLMDLIATMIG